jgi:hypothetical protein
VPAKYHHGDRIFNYSGKAINPGTLPQPKAAKLHKGYADVQHSVNHNMPAALRRSHHSLEAGLRSLNRARKVKL